MEVHFEATYFDGKSSKAHLVKVLFDGRRLRVAGEAINSEPMMEECQINPPVGKAQRMFRLPGGARLETPDLQAVAKLEEYLGLNRGMTIVGRLESRWQWVLLSMVGLVIFTWAFIRFGLPVIAEWAAFVTPPSVLKPLSQQTLKLLDDQYFDPTALSAPRTAQLEGQFRRITHDIGGNYSYRLEFRSSPTLGANALALPSGTVIITDELVKLAKNDREIVGVLAHEVGHVTHRHSLRGVYQSAGVVLVISLLLGDVTSVTSIAASLPAVLIQSGYSRNFEGEADTVAGDYLLRRGWGTKPLRDILDRLTQGTSKGQASLLSTHPGTQERIKNLKALEQH